MPDSRLQPASADVASPCIRVCRIGRHGHCSGCGRDLDEIAAWPQLSAAMRLQVRERAAARLRDFKEDAA